jgi:hypothetical protein
MPALKSAARFIDRLRPSSAMPSTRAGSSSAAAAPY